MSARVGFQIWPGSKALPSFDAPDDAVGGLALALLEAVSRLTCGQVDLWAVEETVVWAAGTSARGVDGRRNAQVGRTLNRLVIRGLLRRQYLVRTMVVLLALTREGEIELFSRREAG